MHSKAHGNLGSFVFGCLAAFVIFLAAFALVSLGFVALAKFTMWLWKVL